MSTHTNFCFSRLCLALWIIVCFFLPNLALAEVSFESSIYHEQAQKLSASQAMQKQIAGEFQPTPSPRFNFGFGNSTHWIYLKFSNPSEQTQHSTLELTAPLIDHIDLYDGSTFTLLQQAGEQNVDFSKATIHRLPIFRI